MKKATQLNNLIPMLICDEVQKSIKFYCEVLGFEVVDRMDDVGRSGWAWLRNGKVQIMLASPSYFPEAEKTEGKYPQAVYYFYPEDVIALRQAVIDKGWQASELAVRFYGMKEFEMLDPDGHMLTFGQETDDPPTPE